MGMGMIGAVGEEGREDQEKRRVGKGKGWGGGEEKEEKGKEQ